MRYAAEILSVVCASMLLTGLSACGAESAEPSVADIRAVLVRAELSNPDMMRFDQAMLDAAAHNAGVQSRLLTDVFAVDKGQCVPATNASGFVCDFRTGVPKRLPGQPSRLDRGGHFSERFRRCRAQRCRAGNDSRRRAGQADVQHRRGIRWVAEAALL